MFDIQSNTLEKMIKTTCLCNFEKYILVAHKDNANDLFNMFLSLHVIPIRINSMFLLVNLFSLFFILFSCRLRIEKLQKVATTFLPTCVRLKNSSRPIKGSRSWFQWLGGHGLVKNMMDGTQT